MPDILPIQTAGAVPAAGSWNGRLNFSVWIFSLLMTSLVLLLFNDHLIAGGFIIYNFFIPVLFFSGLYAFTGAWTKTNEKTRLWYLFTVSLLLRLLAVVVQYFFYIRQTGQPFEFNAVDSLFYHEHGVEVAKHFRIFDFNLKDTLRDLNFSDRGYNLYLGTVYAFFGDSIIVPRLINAVLGSITVIYIYKTTFVLFSKPVALIAGVMAMLLPNFMLYLGTHLKETVMLFLLTCAFYYAVLFIKMEQRTLMNICLLLLLFFLLFMFRTVLAAVLFVSFLGYAVAYKPFKSRLLNVVITLFILCCFFMVVFNTAIGVELQEYYEKSNNSLTQNLQFRASREGGNKFALLAGMPLLLALVLIAPFPSWVYVPSQDFLWMFSGANLIRNIYAFFVIAAILQLIRKDWRNISFLLFFTGGYFIALANSGLALSERFQLPAVPMLIMLAAYRIGHQRRNTTRHFDYYLFFISLLILGWNYIKILGRV